MLDFVQDYITLLPRLLPPSLANTLLSLFTTAFGLLKATQSFLYPVISRVISQPDIASLLLLAALLFLSLKILDMAFRAVMFWVRLALRLVFWGAVLAVGFWVYSRGVDGFVDDVNELVAYWGGEYERFRREAGAWKEAEEAKIKFDAWQKGRSRGRGGRRW